MSDAQEVLSGESRWCVLHGDALEVLKRIPDASIDSCVCDPPAGIAFMNREWDKDKGGRDQWIAWLTGVMAEVFRVLKPGGTFCYTDGCWADDDCSEELLETGFELLERLEITANVLRALRRDSARREAVFDAMTDAKLRNEYKDWGGVIGYRAFRRFEAGQTRYFSHRLRRPA